MSFSVNMGQYVNSLGKLNDKLDKAIKNALYQSASEILVLSEPYVPIDEGHLVGSNFIAVSGDEPSSLPLPESKETGKDKLQPPIEGMEKYEVRCGYTMAYANKLHEDDTLKPGAKSRNKGLSQPMTKYLERVINPRKINEGFAKRIDKELNKS
jgi:hypothetical protein